LICRAEGWDEVEKDILDDIDEEDKDPNVEELPQKVLYSAFFMYALL
jgi:hypothetical protein